MANKTQVIRIESILGGHSAATHFANTDQFLSSYGIDPSLGQYDGVQGGTSYQPLGLIRPTPTRQLSVDDSIEGVANWIIGTPRRTVLYVYCSNGSIHTISSDLDDILDLGDLNDGGGATGNGAAYYDNYVYFARNTTVARYGPLDGTPSFTDDYWVGTLGKTALSNLTYPIALGSNQNYPDHILHRHSDGKLYILDVVDNQGALHYIQTSKTTVEGDTDAGSTYDKVHVGYGLYPTAVESYGSQLVVAFSEMENPVNQTNFPDTKNTAKIAFWDTTSQKVNSITWNEFPDQMVTAIKNVNGVLYFISGSNLIAYGYRISRYIGGNSFETIYENTTGSAPPAGAVDSIGDRVYFGTLFNDLSGTEKPSVVTIGKGWGGVSNGIFSVQGVSYSTYAGISAIKLDVKEPMKPIVAWSTGSIHGIDIPYGYGNIENRWHSQIYKIGQPFKITKIRIPLLQTLTSNMDVGVDFYVDGIPNNGTTNTDLLNINSTNFGQSTKSCVFRPRNLTGSNDFSLGLRWTGTDLCTIGLPITIEYELLDVDTSHP